MLSQRQGSRTALTGGTDVPQDRVHLLKGEPEDVIPQFARDNAVDLIVMGTVALTGIAGLLIGSTAERLLRHVECSLLTVKPEEFVSPVKLDG